MAIARRRFAFSGKPESESNTYKWNWNLFQWKGKYGRFEAWDESVGEVTSKAVANFATTGLRSFYVEKITIDGNAVYTSGRANPDIIVTDLRINQGFASITLKPDASIIPGKDSVATLTIAQGSSWIPWINYRDRPEFNYEETMGMLDPDAVPARSIAVSHEIDTDFAGMSSTGILSPFLIGLLAQTSVIDLASAADSTLKGKGIVRIYANDNGSGRSIVTDGGDVVTNIPEPKPIIGYKYNTGWTKISLDFGAGTSLQVNVPNETFTSEQFLLKYQPLTLLTLRSLCSFPFLMYTESYPRIPTAPKEGPVIDSQGNSILPDTQYRDDMFGLTESKPVLWVDRLRDLSKLGANTITRPEISKNIPVSPKYTRGIQEEYLFLNSRIKINKLVRIDSAFLKNFRKIETFYGEYGQQDPIAGIYDVSDSSTAASVAAMRSELASFYPSVSGIPGAAENFDAIKFYAIIEANALSDAETIASDKPHTLFGKLINPAWLRAHKGVLNQGSMIDEPNLWQWLNVSKEVVEFLRDDTAMQDRNVWVFVIRGLGDEDNQEEAILKDSINDFISAKASDSPNASGVGTGVVNLASRGIPVIRLFGKMVGDVEEPSELLVKYVNADGETRELTRKLLLPGATSWTFTSDSVLTCALAPIAIEADDVSELYINYPESGPNIDTRKEDGTLLVLPRVKFDVDLTKKAGNALPFSHPDYQFQVLFDGEILPYKPSETDPYASGVGPGWVPIMDGSKFVGVMLNNSFNKTKEDHSVQLRCLNVSANTATRTSYLKKAKSLDFTLSGSAKFDLYVNRISEESVTSLETVGIHRQSPANDWYAELVPGKGLKVYAGHGASFQQYPDAPNGDRIQGILNLPFVDIDPYGENSASGDKQAEANGVRAIGKGSEVEIRTNLKYAPSGGGSRVVAYTLTATTEIVDQNIILNAIYDRLANESMIVYTRTDNKIAMKKASFEYAEVSDYRTFVPFGIDNGYTGTDLTYTNDKWQRVLYFGLGTKATPQIMPEVKVLPAGKISGVDRFGTPVETEHPAPGILIKVDQLSLTNIFVNLIKFHLTNYITGYAGTWKDTVVVNVSYSVMGDENTFVPYGYERSTSSIEPKNFFLRFRNQDKPEMMNIVDLALIENPAFIKIEFALPAGLLPSEMDDYLATLALAQINKDSVEMYYVIDEQVPLGSAAGAYRNRAQETYIIYQGNLLYDDAGKVIDKSEYGTMQVVHVAQSQDRGFTWRHPRMDAGQNEDVPAETYKKEAEELKKAGFTGTDSSGQVKAIVRKKKRWDRPMVVSTMGTPTIFYNRKDMQIDMFGFASSGDINRGSLIMWPIQELMFGKDYITEDISKQNILGGKIIRNEIEINRDKNNNRVVETDVRKQIVGVSQTFEGAHIVFYEDRNGAVKSKISDNGGILWKNTGIELFRASSYFPNAKNVFILADQQAQSFHFFAMTQNTNGEGFLLFTYSIPQHYFFAITGEAQLDEYQKEIDKKKKILVVGDASSIPVSDIKGSPVGTNVKTSIGNSYIKDGKYRNINPFRRFTNSSDIGFDINEGYSKIDTNIATLHYVTAHFDVFNRIRVFYLNDQSKIACKVSDTSGATWCTDEVV